MTSANSSSLGGTILPLAVTPTLTTVLIFASTLMSAAMLKESQVSDELNTLNVPEILVGGKSLVWFSSKDVRSKGTDHDMLSPEKKTSAYPQEYYQRSPQSRDGAYVDDGSNGFYAVE